MNPQHLLALLGRYNTDAVVEAALRHYGVRNRPAVEIDPDDADGPVVETQSWVKNSRAGIEFGFDDEAAWIGLDKTEFGKRPMVLTQIYMYGQHDGVRPYQEPLPLGLQLSDDRLIVRKKLAVLEPTRHSHVRDTWDTPDFRITVSYARGDQCIAFVLCMLREPPLPPLRYALAPAPPVDSLLQLLDRPLGDSTVQQAFFPLGLQNQLDEIRESSQADLRIPYGLMLYFADPSLRKPGRVEDFVLSAMMFLQERELDGRGWPGDLPYGIAFDDSPEMVARKVGRPPDAQHDQDFTGVATWHEPILTLRVVYSTMDNRAYRVSAVAPGFRGA